MRILGQGRTTLGSKVMTIGAISLLALILARSEHILLVTVKYGFNILTEYGLFEVVYDAC